MSLLSYFRETKTELHQVTWPTRAQAISYTIVVVAVSIGVALFLGFFDVVFHWLIGLVWQ